MSEPQDVMEFFAPLWNGPLPPPTPDNYDLLFPEFDPGGFRLEQVEGFDYSSGLLDRVRGVLQGLVMRGSKCPCCGQRVEVHPRQIYRTTALWFRELVTEFVRRKDWVHIGDLEARGGDYAKLVYWHLIERDPNRPGYWRPTALGVKWSHGEIRIPRLCYIYNEKNYGFGGGLVTFAEASHQQFEFPVGK